MSKSLILVQDWQGRKAGFRLVSVPDGQANLMVKLGFAKYDDNNTKSGNGKPTRKRASKPRRSKKTSGNSGD